MSRVDFCYPGMTVQIPRWQQNEYSSGQGSPRPPCWNRKAQGNQQIEHHTHQKHTISAPQGRVHRSTALERRTVQPSARPAAPASTRGTVRGWIQEAGTERLSPNSPRADRPAGPRQRASRRLGSCRLEASQRSGALLLNIKLLISACCFTCSPHCSGSDVVLGNGRKQNKRHEMPKTASLRRARRRGEARRGEATGVLR